MVVQALRNNFPIIILFWKRWVSGWLEMKYSLIILQSNLQLLYTFRGDIPFIILSPSPFFLSINFFFPSPRLILLPLSFISSPKGAGPIGRSFLSVRVQNSRSHRRVKNRFYVGCLNDSLICGRSFSLLVIDWIVMTVIFFTSEGIHNLLWHIMDAVEIYKNPKLVAFINM